MAQQQPAHSWVPSAATGHGPGSKYRPGKLLLGDIQLQQQQQQRRAFHGSSWQCGARNSSWRCNEVFTLASAADNSSTADSDCQHMGVFDQPVQADGLDHKLHDGHLHHHFQHHEQPQQQQQVLPFWKGPQLTPLASSHTLQQPQQEPQAATDTWQHQQQLQQQHQQQQQRPVVFRPGSIGPQFASATLSGSGSSSGSGSDSPTALKAVGRVFGNGEICKLLGFIGAQLLMHVATIQHGMHALHSRQQGLDDDAAQQQQQGPGLGFGAWRLRMPWQRQEGAGAGGAEGSSGSGSGGRSNAAWQAGEAAKQWVVRGVAAEKRIELREALACYTNAVTLEPANREYLCRLAKQWSDLTYEEGATVEQIQEVNSKALEYAQRVMAMAPKSPDGYLAACVSAGRLALFSDNKTKVRLAKEAQEAARTAVSLDPSNDLAHHLMGRWHFEMAQINFVLRQLIRIVYGASLNPGTFDEALQEFSQAVALNPHKLIHRVELGRTHLRLGHKRDAYAHLTAAMDLEVEDINAKLQKEDAELLLAKLQAELKGRSELPASWGGFTAPGIAPLPADSSSSSSGSSGVGAVVGEATGSSMGDATPESSSSSSSSGGPPGGGAGTL